MIGQPLCDDALLCQQQCGCVLPSDDRDKDHTAVLQQADKYDLLRRKDDLLHEGVSAVFGIRLGKAELQALCFDAGHFTAEQAREWLLGWRLRPLLFRAANGG